MINKSLFALIFCLFVSFPVLADIGDITKIQLETTSWAYQSGIGGEFRGTIIGDSIDIGGNTIDNGYQWVTFCLEKDETVEGSTSNYWAYVNDEALRGGINTNSGDSLDYKTAYIYTQFAKGVLNYDYDNSQGERESDASELQEVIWYIEGEMVTLNGKALEWYNEAVAAEWTDIGNVRVLNLYDSYNKYSKCNDVFYGYRQDVLIYVESVPVPAAALLGVLGMAIAGVKLRKFA